MRVTILGNNSALPAFGRNPTAQVVNAWGEHIMLDCGEGTQTQMQRFGVRWRKLNHIFISHLHGDHYFGLFGLVNSMSLLGRTAPLHVYAPAELEAMIHEQLAWADTELSYPFHFHSLPEGAAELVETNEFKVSCFPVEHRIQCHGFVILSKTRGRKILPIQCREHEVPRYFYDRLRQGEDYTHKDGRVVKNEDVTADGPPQKRYAYCADTRYTESFLEYVKGVDLMYHESTYLHAEAHKAADRYHSTSIQAAEFAKKAGVKQLLLGHYSSKYRELSAFRDEARTVFDNTLVSIEGTTYEI